MKVALLVNLFPSIEHPYIFNWVNELLMKGIDLTIIAENVNTVNSSDFWRSRPGTSAHVKRLVHITPGDIPYLLRSIILAILHPGKAVKLLRVLRLSESKLRAVIRKWIEYLPILNCNFDVIHFNAPQIAIRRYELAHYFGAKSLLSFRGQDFSFYPDRYQKLLKEADHLHFISSHLLNLAIQNGYEGEKHTIIPPMVDTSFYFPDRQKRENKPHPFIMFTAARLEWMKGYEFALQAVALLLKRGVDLEYYIAGEGEMKGAIIFTIHQLGIQDHVHLLGWQFPDAIRDWMQKSDLYILASVEEAFNNSVLQAQACGLPVVCSDEGGLPENIEDGVTGLLFQKRDAWDMAEKIETLISNKSLRNQMRENGYQRALSRFTLDAGIKDFQDMYRKIVEFKSV